MAQILLITGKGGVGKSVVSRALVEYMTSNKYPYMLVDADPEVQDVKKHYPEAKVLSFSEDPKKALEPDWIIREASKDENKETTFIVNLSANVYQPLVQWLKFQLPEDKNKKPPDKPQLVALFVTDGCWASIRMFLRSLQDLGDRLPHILVQNEGRLTSSPNWEHIRVPIVNEFLKTYGVDVVTFPLIATPVLFTVDMEVDIVKDKEGKPLLKKEHVQIILDDSHRENNKGYTFEDALSHRDPTIGGRVAFFKKEFSQFFDLLFENNPYLSSPGKKNSKKRNQTKKTSEEKAEAAEEPNGARHEAIADAAAKSSELMLEELAPEVREKLNKLSESLKEKNLAAVVNAIKGLGSSHLNSEGKSVRQIFAESLEYNSERLPSQIDDEYLINLWQELDKNQDRISIDL